ncbi:hypothetical protein MMC26_001536 [Xylographa opegraphella]|nr:hypothetical protein [Xylographa opegraphella]
MGQAPLRTLQWSNYNNLEQIRPNPPIPSRILSNTGFEYADKDTEDSARCQETIFGTIFQPVTKTLLVDDRLVNCRRYSYKPLRRGEIRLILLGRIALRTSEAIGGPNWPTIELVCVPLHEAPSFRAISYAWGPLDDIVSLQIGRRRFLNTTRNLAEGLRNFHSMPGKVQYLWADQLCIDQGNLVERGIQVSMMNEIYSEAAKCVAWLGAEDGDTLLAFETIRRVRATGWNLNPLPVAPVAQRLVRSRTWTAEAELKLWSVEDRLWHALRTLFDREWFSRLWILQEVVIPRVVYFKCGRYTCSQNDLYIATFYLQQMRPSIANSCSGDRLGRATMDVSPSGIQSCNVVHRLRCVKRSAIPSQLFSTLLVESRAKYGCSDAHDRVYALLGLAALVEAIEVPIDYRESVASTYTRATKAIIDKYRSLRIFGALGFKGTSQVANLPSWVPDWSLSVQSDPVLAVSSYDAMTFQFAPGRNFNASLFHPHKPRLNTNAKQLVTTGRIVDRIQGDVHRFSDVQNLIPEGSPLLSLEAILLRILPLFARDCQWGAPENRSGRRDGSQDAAGMLVVQTLTALYCHGDGAEENLLAMEKRNSLRAAAREMLDAFAFSVARGDKTQERPLELQNWLIRLAEMSQPCIGRKLVELAKYRLGLCPRDGQLGDVVCILHGSRVPVLLRPRGDCYEVVGQCYVHGIMEGEAVDWEEDEADLFTLI